MKKKLFDRVLDADAFNVGSVAATSCGCLMMIVVALLVTGLAAIVVSLWRIAIGGMS